MSTSSSPAPRPNLRLLYSRKEAAFMVSLSVRTLDTYIAEGRIPVRRIRGRVLIAHAALERFASQDQE